MARKSKTRQKGSRQQTRQRQARKQQQRRRLLLGGTLLVVVLGIGLFIRYWQQRHIPPQLQGAVEGHYTRGAAGAPVVIKEFSDYT